LIFDPNLFKKLTKWCEEAGKALMSLTALILLLHTIYLVIKHELGF
jgi:hypothetical protein